MKINLLPLVIASIASAGSPLASSTEVWDQVAYPDFCGLNAGLGISSGFSSYKINSTPNSTYHLNNVSIGAFTLGASQVLGYSHWFYVELRENISFGNTFYGDQDDSAVYSRRLNRSIFFDGDSRLFFPFRVSPSNRLSLQPFVGFAVHQAYLKGWLNTRDPRGTLLRQRYLAPLAGLALGYNPTLGFAMRSSLSLHIPHGKQAQPIQTNPDAREYSTLRMQRHGIGLDFLFLGRLCENWTLTGELDFFAYSALSDTTVQWRTNYTACLSAKVGAFYQF